MDPAMDDLTAQERELIMTLRHLRRFTLIIHRNARWRIVVADEETGRTNTSEGDDFGRAGISHDSRYMSSRARMVT